MLKVHGVEIPLTPDDVSPIIWQALANNSYEAKEARSVTKAIKKNDRVLELGTGLGIITTLISRVEGVKVWSFEANPATLTLAKRVLDANEVSNVILKQGILAAGSSRILPFYVRSDLWMSSTNIDQGPYWREITIKSRSIENFISLHLINVLVMDIEGEERELLTKADLSGVERIFLELHDHLYGLSGIKDIMSSLTNKGFSYDPRGSIGACVLFSRDDGEREYQPDDEMVDIGPPKDTNAMPRKRDESFERSSV